MSIRTIFLSTLLFLLFPPPSSAAVTILISGDTNSAAPNTPFIADVNCTLTLTDRGQLLIRSPNGSAIQPSSPPFPISRYAALLRSDGHITVYGPSIWSIHRRRSDPTTTTTTTTGDGVVRSENSPLSRSHMLSSQVLNGNSRLSIGDSALLMRDNCSLELITISEGIVWESDTKGRGDDCFLRLDQRGQLAVVDGRSRLLWASEAAEIDGLYLLVVKNGGFAAVYGPSIWSSESDKICRF